MNRSFFLHFCWLLLAVSAGCVCAAPQAINTIGSLRKAIEFLSNTYGDEYPNGPDYLQRLDSISDDRSAAYTNLQREALINHKKHFAEGAGVRDFERGAFNHIAEKVWQTDDSIYQLDPPGPMI